MGFIIAVWSHTGKTNALWAVFVIYTDLVECGCEIEGGLCKLKVVPQQMQASARRQKTFALIPLALHHTVTADTNAGTIARSDLQHIFNNIESLHLGSE